jgi:hypothetical protein
VNIREYLKAHSDEMMWAVLAAIFVAAIIGFRRKSTGMANFVACVSAALLAAMAYPLADKMGYSWEYIIPGVAVVCGGLSYTFFSMLIRVSDRIETRGDELADRVIDRVLPADGKDSK